MTAATSYFSAAQQRQLTTARLLLGGAESATPARPLQNEARELGLGLAVARELGESSQIDVLVDPARRVMEPLRLDELLTALDRGSG